VIKATWTWGFPGIPKISLAEDKVRWWDSGTPAMGAGQAMPAGLAAAAVRGA